MKKVNNILYAGIFVKEDQLERLFSIEPRPEDSRIIEHPHVTLFFRDNVSLEIMQYVLTHNEQYHSIIVDGIGISDKAIALHVSSIKSETGEEVPSMNKVKHITLYLLNDGKPVDSNSITEWTSIEPTSFIGYLRIIYKKNEHKKPLPKNTADNSGKDE